MAKSTPQALDKPLDRFCGVYTQGLVHMAKTEGVRGCFKGNGANCIRIIPNSAVKFFCYEQISRWVLGAGASTLGWQGPAARQQLYADASARVQKPATGVSASACPCRGLWGQGPCSCKSAHCGTSWRDSMQSTSLGVQGQQAAAQPPGLCKHPVLAGKAAKGAQPSVGDKACHAMPWAGMLQRAAALHRMPKRHTPHASSAAWSDRGIDLCGLHD